MQIWVCLFKVALGPIKAMRMRDHYRNDNIEGVFAEFPKEAFVGGGFPTDLGFMRDQKVQANEIFCGMQVCASLKTCVACWSQRVAKLGMLSLHS